MASCNPNPLLTSKIICSFFHLDNQLPAFLIGDDKRVQFFLTLPRDVQKRILLRNSSNQHNTLSFETNEVNSPFLENNIHSSSNNTYDSDDSTTEEEEDDHHQQINRSHEYDSYTNTNNSSSISYSNDDTSGKHNNFSINPKQWTVERVKKFIALIINNTVAEKFLRHKINGAAMFLLNMDVLLNIMNIELGPSLIILNEIAILRENFKQYL